MSNPQIKKYLNWYYCITLIMLVLWLKPMVQAQNIQILQHYNTANSPLPDNSVNALLKQGNTLWIATENGLAQLAGGQWQVYTDSNSPLPDNKVRSLAAYESQILIGTFTEGLVVYDGINWQNFQMDNAAISDNCVRTIQALPNTTKVWLGTSGGIDIWNTLNNTFENYNNLSPGIYIGNVIDILFDSEQTAWLSTLNSGLISLDNNIETYNIYTTYNGSGIPGNTINDIAIDPDGSKWLAMGFHGLVRLNNDGTWTIFDPSNSGLNSQQLSVVLRDNWGNLLIGTLDDGLYIANPDNNEWLHLYSGNSSLPDDHISDIVAINDTSIYVATHNGGLLRIAYTGYLTAISTPPPAVYSTQAATLKVYPNPSTSNTSIQLILQLKTQTSNTQAPPSYLEQTPANNNNTPISIQLFNAWGQLIKQVPITNLGHNVLELPSLTSGMYFLQLTTTQDSWNTAISIY